MIFVFPSRRGNVVHVLLKSRLLCFCLNIAVVMARKGVEISKSGVNILTITNGILVFKFKVGR